MARIDPDKIPPELWNKLNITVERFHFELRRLGEKAALSEQ